MGPQPGGIDRERIALSVEEEKRIYDKVKYESFVKSSRLEGIEIIPVQDALDELALEYRKIGADNDAG